VFLNNTLRLARDRLVETLTQDINPRIVSKVEGINMGAGHAGR
jgi:hypothetical protein